MVVQFNHLWISIPLLLIPVMFCVVMMAITRIWMFGAPTRERKFPQYSLHVMYEPPPKHIQRLQGTLPPVGSGGGKSYPGYVQDAPMMTSKPKLQPQDAPHSMSRNMNYGYGHGPAGRKAASGYDSPTQYQDPRSRFI